MTRIVAGKFRRRKLTTRSGLATRPIPDRVKEQLFQHLRDELEGRRVADVFAGTGTIGLEALSRGASSVVFIENDRQAHGLLRRNVAMLEAERSTLCWRTDAFRSSFRPKGTDAFLPYDLIFFDPPYRMIPELVPGKPLYKSLQRLARDDVSSPGARLVIRTPRQSRRRKNRQAAAQPESDTGGGAAPPLEPHAGHGFCYPVDWRFDSMLSVSTMEIHLFRKREGES